MQLLYIYGVEFIKTIVELDNKTKARMSACIWYLLRCWQLWETGTIKPN